MTMPHPQFTLKTLLWLMAVVAAFGGGATVQRQFDKPLTVVKTQRSARGRPTMELRDGSTWIKVNYCLPSE